MIVVFVNGWRLIDAHQRGGHLYDFTPFHDMREVSHHACDDASMSQTTATK